MKSYYLSVALLLLASPPLAHALNVTLSPGSGSIQAAIDRVAASGGGTVFLNAGTYFIGSSMTIHSNVTIDGAGQGATIVTRSATATATFNLLDDGGKEGLSNFGCRDLTLDARNTHNLCIEASSLTSTHRNVKYTNVECRNSWQGCGTSGTTGLIITNCNMHHSGGANANGTANQNMYTRRMRNLVVSNSKFDNSPEGVGAKVSIFTGVSFTSCQFNGNRLTGLCFQDVNHDAIVKGCTANSNKGTGPRDGGYNIVADNLTVDGNTANNNAHFGVCAYTTGGTNYVINNRASGNPAGNYSLHGTWTTRLNNF